MNADQLARGDGLARAAAVIVALGVAVALGYVAAVAAARALAELGDRLDPLPAAARARARPPRVAVLVVTRGALEQLELEPAALEAADPATSGR